MLRAALRPLLYLLAVYHLLVFTVPHLNAFYQDLISSQSMADDQMSSDERRGDFIIELKELEELEENDASVFRLDLQSLSTVSLFCFCITPQVIKFKENNHFIFSTASAVPLHLRLRSLLI